MAWTWGRTQDLGVRSSRRSRPCVSVFSSWLVAVIKQFESMPDHGHYIWSYETEKPSKWRSFFIRLIKYCNKRVEDMVFFCRSDIINGSIHNATGLSLFFFCFFLFCSTDENVVRWVWPGERSPTHLQPTGRPVRFASLQFSYSFLFF